MSCLIQARQHFILKFVFSRPTS